MLDGLGGEHLLASYRALDDHGRLISFGFSAAVDGRSPRRQLLRQAARVLDWSVRPGGPRVAGYRLSAVGRLADGSITPRIAATFPLADAAAAHRLLERGSVPGKVLLTSEH